MTVRKRLSIWYICSLVACSVIISAHAYKEGMMRDHKVYNKERSREILNFTLGLALPMALLALGGGWWLSRRSLDELQTITDAAERTQADNLAEVIPRSHNGDEFDRLAEVFNDMRQRLQTSFEQVREFTLAASHELKTPLTIMRAGVETALQRIPQPAGAQRLWMENLVDEIDRLARIVDQLTFLSKADAGIIAIEMKSVNLSSLIQDATDDAHTLASLNQIQVSCIAPANVIVWADPLRLRQMLLNLIDNAVKYNLPGGKLNIILKENIDHVLIRIENNTEPISAADQARVFDRFFRGHEHQAQSIEGSGLGLNIVRWVVESHHGTVKFSASPEGWAAVTVQLPINKERTA